MNVKLKKQGVSIIRLYLMRILYLLTFLGLGVQSWNEILNPSEPFGTYDGIAYSFWVAYATLMGFGLRYPLKMLPLILLQLFYKAVWVLGIYLPMKRVGLLDDFSEDFLWICIMAIVLDVIVIPWGYFYREYVKPLFSFRGESGKEETNK